VFKYTLQTPTTRRDASSDFRFRFRFIGIVARRLKITVIS